MEQNRVGYVFGLAGNRWVPPGPRSEAQFDTVRLR